MPSNDDHDDGEEIQEAADAARRLLPRDLTALQALPLSLITPYLLIPKIAQATM
jgi:hypothetical protein